MLRSNTVIWLAVIVMADLACSLSGLSAPASNGPMDSNSLSTIVVGTASAAAAQTAQADLLTRLPSAASTAEGTSALTTTGTPGISVEGTSLVKQDDGSHLFTDSQGGYSMVISTEWLVMRPNEPEYMNASGLPSASDPKLQAFLNNIQKQDPKLFRLAAADITPAHMQENLLSTFTVSWDRNSTMTLPEQATEAVKEITTLNGLNITNTDTGTSSTHIPMAIIESSVTSTNNLYGRLISAYQKNVIFKVKAGTVNLTLKTTPTLKDAILKDFDAMTDQIKMLP
jgi:hypothetical protein